MMMTRWMGVGLLAMTAALGGAPWDKAPAKWELADVYRILQDSPWSPAGVKLEAKSVPRRMDRQSGVMTDAPLNPNEASSVPGMQISRSKPQPDVPVLWWSSKTVRLARLRLRQLRNPALANEPLQVEALPDYVLVVEGSDALRILRDAKEDLHDTVFLELSSGATLDLLNVRFVEGSDDEEAHVEFHFPREVEGQPTLDVDAERVILHCKAVAKTARGTQNNVLSFRAEFKPRSMRVRGEPDL